MPSNVETKVIKCMGCGKAMEVGKFASKKQRCTECADGASTPQTPRQKLEKAQRVLADLGFVQTEVNKYSKTYSDPDGTTFRVEPYFHKGAVKGMEDCTIEAFQITSQRMVMVKPSAANLEEQWEEFEKKVPACTLEDMGVVWNTLVSALPANTEEHYAVEQVVCSKCGKPAAEWVISGKATKPICTKCFGMKTPISIKSVAAR